MRMGALIDHRVWDVNAGTMAESKHPPEVTKVPTFEPALRAELTVNPDKAA